MKRRKKLTSKNYCAKPEDRVGLGYTQASSPAPAPSNKKWQLSPGLPDGLVRYLRSIGRLK